MAAISIKNIRGRQYRYLQWYEGGSRVPKSKYLGPVHPKRKRGVVMGYTAGEITENVVMGLLSFTARAATGKLGPPGGRAYKSKPSEPAARSHKIAEDKVRTLDAKYGIDKSNVERFHETRARLPAEMLREHFVAERAAWAEYHAEKEQQQPKAEKSPATKEFEARIVSRGSDPSEMSAEPDAPDAAEPDGGEGES